jgi:hypothetical protein
MYLELIRRKADAFQTLGKMKLFDSHGNQLLQFDTLELAWNNNERGISCIPSGVYVVKRKTSFRHGQCFELQNVTGRSNILIHSGNFNRDTKGCILIGSGLTHIDDDCHMDIMNSCISMRNLLRTLRTTTTIAIVNNTYRNE